MKRFYLLAAALLAFASCSNEELVKENITTSGVIRANFEQGASASRLAIGSDNKLTWTSGDCFVLFNNDGTAYYYSTAEGGETASFSGTTSADDTYQGAAFPATENATSGNPSYSNGTITMTLPGELDQETAGNCNLPMWADVTSLEGTISFKHLAGVLRVNLSDIPEGYNQLIVNASNPISGEFTIENESDNSNDKVLKAKEDNSDAAINVAINGVTVTFTAATATDNDAVVYIPLPVGTYQSISVSISNGNENPKNLVTWSNKTVERAKIYTALLTYQEVDASTPSAVSNALSASGLTTLQLNLSETIDATGDDAGEIDVPTTITTLGLNFAASPTTSSEKPLVIKSNEDATSGTATQNINIDMPEDDSDSEGVYLEIKTPTSTVTLNGGNYKKITATTATNTLIIGEGVTIEELVINGGNVKLEGDLELTKPLEVRQDLVLDLGGKTLTTAESLEEGSSAAVIVYSGEVTIKNGTIATSGAAAHKDMGALWVRGEETASVTIEDGAILKGNNWNEEASGQIECMATVYVSNSNGSVTINGGEFYCVKQEQVEGQNQILNYKNDLGQKIFVKGGKFHGMNPAKGNGVEVSYLAENAIVAEIAENTFEVLSSTDETIVLSEDMTVYSPLEVRQDLVLDLGGKTLTTAEELTEGSSAAVIVYSGEVTIKNGTIETSGLTAHKDMGALWVRGEETASVTIEDGAILKGNNWNEEASGQIECMATVYVSNSNGSVTINGGEFYCVQQEQVEGQNQILNYKNDLEQKIFVKGGKFHGMNPAKGNGVEVSYLAENAIVAETAENTFEVLSSTDGTIVLSEDMTVYSPLEVRQDLVLDLGGKTLTTAEELTEGSSAAVIVYSGEVTIKNGTIETSGLTAHKDMGALWVRGTETASVTIEDGAILKGNNWNEEVSGQIECMATVYVSNANGSVTIEGGEFYCVQQEQADGQNQILNYLNSFTENKIVVQGGKFYRMDPAKGNGVETSYLAEGYVSTEGEENGVKVYTVSATDAAEE